MNEEYFRRMIDEYADVNTFKDELLGSWTDNTNVYASELATYANTATTTSNYPTPTANRMRQVQEEANREVARARFRQWELIMDTPDIFKQEYECIFDEAKEVKKEVVPEELFDMEK